MSTSPRIRFVGSSSHNLDGKFRLTIPSKWRGKTSEDMEFIGMPDPEGCLAIHPPRMIEKMEDRAAQISMGDTKGQDVLAQVFGNAETFSFDKQGRIILPDGLREHANIKKGIVLVGHLSHFRIWSLEEFEKKQKKEERELSSEMQELKRALQELGL
jgi:MraZ protein|tara:strand:+ start:605 stop:1075 length:471 start_codon:yes stop_codon:yes gene_type:complete